MEFLIAAFLVLAPGVGDINLAPETVGECDMDSSLPDAFECARCLVNRQAACIGGPPLPLPTGLPPPGVGP